MGTQSYPWFKFAHVEYLLDPMMNAMSLAAQGANTRLMAYAARQLPFGTLPNDEKTLFAMSGANSLKQWKKLHTELIGITWFVNDDNRLFCPLMNIESAPVTQAESQEEQAERSNEAERARRYRENKKNRDEKNEPSRTVTDSDRDASHDRHATVTHENVTHRDATVTHHDDDRDATVTLRDEMGGRGEDLDSELKQDLDLNQEVKTKTPREASVCDARFDEFWIQYPRKENKQGAMKAWKKIKPSEKLFEEIIFAVSKQKSWPAFQNGYAPHAATWLNGNRWEDQPPINQTNTNQAQEMGGSTSPLMESNRRAVAEAKRMLFGSAA